MKNETTNLKFPLNQTLCLTYTTTKGVQFYITANKDKSKYTSWKVVKDKLEKIKTSANPTLLEKDFK